MLRSHHSGAGRHKVAVTFIAALACAAAACGDASLTHVGSIPTGSVTQQLIVQPAEVTLPPDDSAEFRAFGLSASGDTTAIQLSWSTTDGTVRGKGNGNAWGVYRGNKNGKHKVVAIDTSGVADTAVVTVLAAPTADFSFSAADLAVTFADLSTDADGSVTWWSWDFGDGASTTERSPSHTYDAAGSYAVTLTVADNDGLTGSVTRTISVSEKAQAPTADFSYSAADLVVTFSDTSSDPDGSIASWSWSFGDGASSTTRSPSHTYVAAGSYDVTLTVTDNDGLTGSVTRTVSVSPSGASQVVKLAFIGDQGWESPGSFDGPRAVLQLIKDEGADAVVHQGDFDYDDDPEAWVQQIDDVLGPDFPYFVSVGNHDVARWDGAGGYKERMEQRATRLGFSWTGELGENAELHFRGIHLLFGAPGTLDGSDTFYADYFAGELAADTSTWRVCSWHKNQKLMQVGGKSDGTGWGVYEACRAGGAVIATGHEHSYSRTHLLSSMEHQTVASTSDTLRITEGETFAFVSGLGGKSIRDQELSGDWWASIYTSTQNATHGALFGVFNIEGRDDMAFFYFKDIDGNVVDAFWVVSAVK
jgi:PKD repeat protein